MATAAAYNATQGWGSNHTKATYDRALPIIQRLGSDQSTFDTMIGIYYYYNVLGQMDQGAPVIVDAVNYADRQAPAANNFLPTKLTLRTLGVVASFPNQLTV